jgi:hypothetical protein
MRFFSRTEGKRLERKQRNAPSSVFELQEPIPLLKSYPRTNQLPDQVSTPPIKLATNILPQRQNFPNPEKRTVEGQELQNDIDCQRLCYEIENLRTQLQLTIEGQYKAMTQLSHEQERSRTVAEQLTQSIETGQMRDQVLTETTEDYRRKLSEYQQ